jgi:hypothetical protein
MLGINIQVAAMRATFLLCFVQSSELAYSGLGTPFKPWLIRPFGLPSRKFQPDRDQAYRTPVLGAFDFHP